MIIKYKLRFVTFTWPNLCLWVAILCSTFVNKNPQKIKTLKPKNC